MKLACQEHLIPGNTIIEKWDVMRRVGFDAIELRGEKNFTSKSNVAELRKAAAAGVRFSSVCVISDHFIGDFDKTKRLDALAHVKSLLSIIAELGGTGAITPASYGMHSNVLPPFTAERTPEKDKAILSDMLFQLGDHARQEGTLVLLEPLNRYEDHMLNRVEQAVALCREIQSTGLSVMADVYHMNVEEASIVDTLNVHRDFISHLHIADSNRLEPGQGHINFADISRTLKKIGFSGFCALECSLKDSPIEAFKKTKALFN